MRKTRGLVKDRLATGLETEVVFTPDDLEDLLAATASLKNRGGNRGRFTPNQLVIGQNPRVPHELLSDDPADEVGMQELIRDNADLDSPAKAFKHSVQIRDHARMLMETDTARERSRSAGRAQVHRDRSYHRGQWVCLAKGSAWRERSNWGSSALSVGASGTRRSSRWYHRVGIDARTTLEVRVKADAGSDQPRVIGCRVPDSRSSVAAGHGRSLPDK